MQPIPNFFRLRSSIYMEEIVDVEQKERSSENFACRPVTLDLSPLTSISGFLLVPGTSEEVANMLVP